MLENISLATGLAIIGGIILLLKLIGWGVRALVRTFLLLIILLAIIFYFAQNALGPVV